jgi:hypothetical protein
MTDLQAQKPADSGPETKQGMVAGLVSNAQTGTVIGGAIVTLTPISALGTAPAAEAGVLSTVSRDDGSFQFEDVSTGSYAIAAERKGFVKNRPGLVVRKLAVPPEGHIRNLVIRLSPEAQIQGRMIDPHGDPLTNTTVKAFTESATSTVRRLREAGRAITNATGEYSIDGLPPGKYVLFSDPVYYPSALTLDASLTIDLAPGERARGLVIAFPPDTLQTVRGRVIGPVENTEIYVVPHSGRLINLGALANRSAVAADGSFQFGGIAAGRYTLQLVSTRPVPRLLSSQQIAVGHADLTDVVVAPSVPPRIAGRFRLESGSNFDFSSTRLTLTPAVSATGSAASVAVTVQSDGRFQSEKLEPAPYFLRVAAPEGLYLRAIRLDGQDMRGVPLDLSQTFIESVEIVLSAGVGRVEGSISRQSQGSPAIGFVILNPRNMASGERRVAAIREGGFSIAGVPPGSYDIIASQLYDPDLFDHPEFLRQIAAQIVACTVRENETKQVDVALMDSGEVTEAALHAGLVSY